MNDRAAFAENAESHVAAFKRSVLDAFRPRLSASAALSPKDKPVHSTALLATVYYALGIDPAMGIRSHLNQPKILSASLN